jgi:hypothetical protein
LGESFRAGAFANRQSHNRNENAETNHVTGRLKQAPTQKKAREAEAARA